MGFSAKFHIDFLIEEERKACIKVPFPLNVVRGHETVLKVKKALFPSVTQILKLLPVIMKNKLPKFV